MNAVQEVLSMQFTNLRQVDGVDRSKWQIDHFYFLVAPPVRVTGTKPD